MPYQYDEQSEWFSYQRERPWLKDPHYFKRCKISSLALLKMIMHAKSGGKLEIMGLMNGKLRGDTVFVTDCFALPVEGTETRVNAHAEADNYIIEYKELSPQVGRTEHLCGWYHSHPGYNCWLSGIDVSTQMLWQKGLGSFIAIVVDPILTMASGQVALGAFRTYPEEYKPPGSGKDSEYQQIPMDKIEDFGVHADRYYPLKVSYYKSKYDQTLFQILWTKYWINTLASSPLIANMEYLTDQIVDLSGKIAQASAADQQGKKEHAELSKLTRDSDKLAVEAVSGLTGQMVKDMLFNRAARTPTDCAVSPPPRLFCT